MQTNFWEEKTPCWETMGCMGQPGKGKECPAYKAQRYPCWNILGTLCKGPRGRDPRQCQECSVYKKYGEGRPILIFDPEQMDKLNL